MCTLFLRTDHIYLRIILVIDDDIGTLQEYHIAHIAAYGGVRSPVQSEIHVERRRLRIRPSCGYPLYGDGIPPPRFEGDQLPGKNRRILRGGVGRPSIFNTTMLKNPCAVSSRLTLTVRPVSAYDVLQPRYSDD